MNELESVVSWIKNGTAFIVHDPEKLVEILPKFFGQTKYRSFRRQLNMWHFHRITEGPNRGAFMHPCFVRGNKQLMSYMSRHSAPLHSTSTEPHTPAGERQRQTETLGVPAIASSSADFHSRSSNYASTSASLDRQHDGPLAPIAASHDHHSRRHYHHRHQLPPVMEYSHHWQPALGQLNYNYAQPVPPPIDSNYARVQPYNYTQEPLREMPLDETQSAHKIETFEPSAIRLTESPIMASPENKLPGISTDGLNDGDPITFAGRQFHFLDYSSSPNKKPRARLESSSSSSSSLTAKEEEKEKGSDTADAFADDTPLIVSDSLMEPMRPDIFDSIF